MEKCVDEYNSEVSRWTREGRPREIDAFVNYESLKWSEHLKQELMRVHYAEYDESKIRQSLYRPFSKQVLYYDSIFNDRPSLFDRIFPNANSEQENAVICISGTGHRAAFTTLIADAIPNYSVNSLDGFRCFPLYTYALDGKLRRDNITDWALGQFQAKYGPEVTKRDIFHYVYGLLHSPQYRERYKENLKRELPRIPLVKEADAFQTFVSVGAALAALHVGYEKAKEYPLKLTTTKGIPRSWRVTKMRLKGTSIEVNESLTLEGIPAEAFDYKLGNRSALGWVLDQYQVSTDKRSGIVTDPNRADDPEYIVRLVRRVVTVSVETARLVATLPPFMPAPADSGEAETTSEA